MKRFVLVAMAAAVVIASAHVRAMISEQARIDSGMVAGTASGQPSVRVFKGIPFAAPPLSENRWKPPQPVAKWAQGRCLRRAVCRGPGPSRSWWSTGRGRGRGPSHAGGRAGPASARARTQRGLPLPQRLDERQ
jgi:hypothetical protein